LIIIDYTKQKPEKKTMLRTELRSGAGSWAEIKTALLAIFVRIVYKMMLERF